MSADLTPMADKMRAVLERECPCVCADGQACTYHQIEPLLETFATVAREHVQGLFSRS